MTRSFVRTLLIAVCLTAFSASPARCDNWFNFSKWGRKTAPSMTVSSEQASGAEGAYAGQPARTNNWFNFSKWGQNTAPTKTVSSEQVSAPAGVATVSDANCSDAADEDCDEDECDFGSKWKAHRQEKKERKAQKRALAELKAMGPPPCYPALNSSLYPCPRPDVPYEVGQTLITNQAFYPHEMLYAHQYRAMYPPYFYENKCGLACLPFFPKPCLKGTVVTVKYKSTLPHGFHPPSGATKTCFSNTQFK